LSDKVDFAVFPRLQGGPKENVIAGVAVALQEAAGEDFKEIATFLDFYELVEQKL